MRGDDRQDNLVETSLQELSPDALQEVYTSLLKPAFRPDELMTLEEMASAYAPGSNDPSCVVLRAGAPVAVMLGEWYADRSVLLLAYLAVSREARGHQLGTRLVRIVLPTWYATIPSAVVLAEVDDPRSWPDHDDGGSAEARLRFYDRLGARLLPMRYFQPSLRPGSARVPGMFLLRLDASRAVRSGILSEFLTEYFTICEGSKALMDPEVIALLSRAATIDLNDGTWPVGRWLDVPPA